MATDGWPDSLYLVSCAAVPKCCHFSDISCIVHNTDTIGRAQSTAQWMRVPTAVSSLQLQQQQQQQQ